MRAVSHETLEAVLHDAPAPRTIDGTGIDGVELMKPMIKDMYVAAASCRPTWRGSGFRPCDPRAHSDGDTRKLVEALGSRQGYHGAALRPD
jgi:hypothetical protein